MLSFVLSLRIFAFRHIQKLQPALVIVSSPPLPMAAATVRHFRKRGFRVLLNVSDIWPLSAKALGALNRKKLYKRLERIASKMYESADAITAQSNETLEHIRRHCKRMPPSFLYRNLPAQNGQPYLEAQGQKVKIVYPGLLGHAQGVLQLCRAIDFHRLGAELHVYGQGPQLEALQSLAANDTRAIYVHEPVDPDEMALVLADADAMLIPLVAPIEGALPSKLFTALQMGLPVFFSGGGEGASIVAEHRLGWVSAPGDYDLIARQIAGLVSMSAQQLKEWRTEIRRVADQLFNKAIQDSRFVNFIQAAISNK
jgi:glycosyltransferase involved in cell wall biosynthesis